MRSGHTSPDAPAVYIAVKVGAILFGNVTFKGVGSYLPVDAGAYDLEVRLAGTDTVALDVPAVSLTDGKVYIVFAMGLAGGEPALSAAPSVYASRPVARHVTGYGPTQSALSLPILLAAAGLLTLADGLLCRTSRVRVQH